MPIGSSAYGPAVGADFEPTTLTARAALRLSIGPLDPVTLMRDVCKVQKLQRDAAEKMADALLGPRPEFVHLPDGCWALRENAPAYLFKRTATGEMSSPIETALTDLSFAVVDVETTGTQASGPDRITEIAIVQVREGKIADVYSKLVNPERTIPTFITSLTNISWDMVKDELPFRGIADEVLSKLSGNIFTAHNAAFDWRFVSEEMSRASGRQLYGKRLCTVRMTKKLLPQLSRRSLDHVTNYFGINIGSRHRAEGDAVATAEVLLRLLSIARERDIASIDQLLSRVNAVAEPRSRTAGDRRRLAFPQPVIKDDIA